MVLPQMYLALRPWLLRARAVVPRPRVALMRRCRCRTLRSKPERRKVRLARTLRATASERMRLRLRQRNRPPRSYRLSPPPRARRTSLIVQHTLRHTLHLSTSLQTKALAPHHQWHNSPMVPAQGPTQEAPALAVPVLIVRPVHHTPFPTPSAIPSAPVLTKALEAPVDLAVALRAAAAAAVR